MRLLHEVTISDDVESFAFHKYPYVQEIKVGLYCELSICRIACV